MLRIKLLDLQEFCLCDIRFFVVSLSVLKLQIFEIVGANNLK